VSAWWHEATNAISQDFAGLADPAELARASLRLVVALACGAMVGYERESIGKAAGLRTHMLVSMGAALVMLMPLISETTEVVRGHVIQGIVTGVGFLGAGAIIKRSDADQIHGLTTAAGLWLTAAIGMAAGLGRLLIALVATLLAFLVLSALRAVESPLSGSEQGVNEDGRRQLWIPGQSADSAERTGPKA